MSLKKQILHFAGDTSREDFINESNQTRAVQIGLELRKILAKHYWVNRNKEFEDKISNVIHELTADFNGASSAEEFGQLTPKGIAYDWFPRLLKKLSVSGVKLAPRPGKKFNEEVEALEESIEHLVPIMTKALKKALFQLGDDAKDSEILKIAKEIISHKIPMINGSHLIRLKTLLNGMR